MRHRPRPSRFWGAVAVLAAVVAQGVAATPAAASTEAPAAPNVRAAVPTPVAAGVAAAGDFHSCATVSSTRELQCWGSSSSGQASVPADNEFLAISAGRTVTCGVQYDGVTSAGPLLCWGGADAGLLTVPAGNNYIDVDVDLAHACAKTSGWQLVCWGFGAIDQPSAGDYSAVATGSNHACGILFDETIRCWGWDAGSGAVTGAPSGEFTAITSSGETTCAIRKSDGGITCWGPNLNGKATPPAGAFREISLSGAGGCGILTPSLELRCWGVGPGAIAGTFRSVDGGLSHYCAIRETSWQLACWGDNQGGRVTPERTGVGSEWVYTGVAAAIAPPVTHVSGFGVSAAATLPAALSIVGGTVSGTATSPDYALVTVTSVGAVMPFEFTYDLYVGWGPTSGYELRLSDTTPVEGQTVDYAVWGLDPLGSATNDLTMSVGLVSDVTGDVVHPDARITFADFDPSAGVTVAHTHTFTITSIGNPALHDDVPVSVGPRVTALDLSLDPTTVAVRGTSTATVIARDASGTAVADVTAYSTFGSTGLGDSIAGGVVTVSGATGSRTITAQYGTLSDSVGLSATPGPLARLEVTPSALTADTGDTVTITATGFDADDNTLGDLTSTAAVSSSITGDAVAGNAVTFAFDPAGHATTPIAHRLTATIGGVSGFADVTVAPIVDDIRLSISAMTAQVGDTVEVTVVALDAAGDPIADVSDRVVVTSNQGDRVEGNRVTFLHASPHRITATYGTLSASAVVEVSPRRGLLGVGGVDAGWGFLVAGLLLVAGAATIVVARRAPRRVDAT